jgi:putative glycosyltransferase (TIGR04372 family)
LVNNREIWIEKLSNNGIETRTYYPDTNIDNYNEAIKWSVNKGVWVFRMGRKVHNPISIQHPKIIDYPFSKTQSDLIDIWMFANCNLCISSGSGPDTVSDIYGRLLLFLNYLPIFNLFSWSNATSVPKYLNNIKTGKRLTLSDHIKHTYFDSDQYLKAGIKIEELSFMEILHAVKDCYKDIFDDKTLSDNTDIKLNNIFWDIILKSERAHERHGFIHEKSRIAPSFLKNNINWLK